MDYLDVTFNLTDSSCRPFNRTNNEINYIHKQLNHPPSIIKQLPLSVKKPLSKLYSDEKIFNDFIPIYQEELIKSGYNNKLTYQKHDQKKTTHKSVEDKSFGLTAHVVKMLPQK